jgi:hypothetical protein
MENDSSLELAVDAVQSLSLNVETSLLTTFYELLQAGFRVRCRVGVNIESLFNDQFEINQHLVEERISTIFLNGKPVDDIASTTVSDGSTLALSGAMPGLVGATLRRKSPLSSFRQSISAEKTPEDSDKKEGYIQIKLFNILLEELGPEFLKKGILVPRGHLKTFFNKQSEAFWQGCIKISADGRPVTADQILSYLDNNGNGVISLSVIF